MRPPTFLRLAVAIALLASDATAQSTRSDRAIRPFRSNEELARYLRVLTGVAEPAAVVPPQPPVACPPAGDGALPAGVIAVRGRVTTADGSAVEGAQVVATKIGVGTATCSTGEYRLLVPRDSVGRTRRLDLAARRIGYEAARRRIRLAASGPTRADFSLKPAAVALEAQVIADGYKAEAAPSAPPAAARADASATSITNNQHAGVDEGDIVKRRGGHLVILRRGRLFTVAIGDGALRPISFADAFGPGIDPSGTWYDELLVSENRVVVIGYSYQRGGTEVGIFDIDRGGRLSHAGTYQLRSNDYYSSRNYASRLVDDKLVFYAPLYLGYTADPLDALPAMRKWDEDADGGSFRRIATAARVFRPERPPVPGRATVMHSVTVCDLAARDLDCEATVLFGDWGRVFYVSPTAVYVWVRESASAPVEDEGAQSMLYRMPLDGSAPTAIAASGVPVDQFSFLERDGVLDVLVRAEGRGDGMWAAEVSAGDVALLRLPLWRFGDGSDVAPRRAYRALPFSGTGTFTNRFVGEHVLYGAGNGWWDATTREAKLYVAPVRGRGEVSSIALPHGVDRIEALGTDAVVVGSDGASLHFSGVALGGNPALTQHYTLAGASQGELRSHGFFYRRDDEHAGIIGLPIRTAGKAGYSHLFEGSAAVLFLGNDGQAFRELGTLAADDARAADDACVASCVDWYGNARPIFTDGRIFALLGYELVEGTLRGERLRERRRVSFAPAMPLTTSR